MMDESTRARVCSAAGKAAHHYGTAYEWTPDEASAAALKSWVNRPRRTPEKRRATLAAAMRRWRAKKARQAAEGA